MNYCGIKYCDIANGTGCRTVLFVSGCRNKCEGCFQPETRDFNYGVLFDDKIKEEIIESLKPAYVKGITFLGGEPFEPENQHELLPFAREIKEKYPNKDIWCYSGYVYDVDLVEGGRKYTEDTDEFLSYIDILVDGPFVISKKNIMLKFRGSENQRVIDLKKTRESGKITLAME